MKRQFSAILITFLALFLFAGCSKQEVNPVTIDENTDKCEICNMQVKDNQYATQIILDNGKALVFDDIGCMNAWLEENTDKEVDAAFVRDYSTSNWIEIENAVYVYGKSIKTPMAYNVISFMDKEEAQDFIDQHEGKLLTYEDLGNHSWERNKEMMEEMKKMKMESNSENNTMHDHSENDGMSTDDSDTSH